MDPFDYCEQRLATSHSSFAASFRILPPARRRAITAVYAFCREVDDVVDEVGDPGVAAVKLAWWRREIGVVYGGTPQHPVAVALAQVAAEYSLPRADFDAVIDGMQMDLDQQRYPDFATLERYCERVAGAVGRLSARIFGFHDPRTLDYARELGIAFQLTNIVRDVGEDAIRGRIYLPQEDLSRFGVSAQDIFARKQTPAFRTLMQLQVERARDHYRRAFAALPAVDRRAQRPGLMMAAVYRALLDEIERDGFRVLDRRITLAPLYKAWVAWKASWSY